MIVTELPEDDTTEPVWESVGLRGCDFRPQFDGDLYNLFTAIYPLDSKFETETLFKYAAFQIADWVKTTDRNSQMVTDFK